MRERKIRLKVKIETTVDLIVPGETPNQAFNSAIDRIIISVKTLDIFEKDPLFTFEYLECHECNPPLLENENE